MKQSKTFFCCALVVFFGVIVLHGHPATAAMVRYDLADGKLGAFVTIDDNTPDQITFSVSVNELSPYTFIGDIRGLFFDIAPFPAGLSKTDFSGQNITAVSIADNGVTRTSGGNSISPYGPFDVGVEFGAPGTGSDDIRSTVFQIIYAGDLGLNAFTFTGQKIALRLSSVGDPEGEREASSKMFLLVDEGFPPNAVPAPSSLLLIGAGMFGLLAGARRK